MNAVPDEKQGVASAVNDTTREVGAAVGIAVAGSVLAARYNKPSRRAGRLRRRVREPALDSLAKALAVAGQMGPQGAGWPTSPRPRSSTRWTFHFWWSPCACFRRWVRALWAPGRDGSSSASCAGLPRDGPLTR